MRHAVFIDTFASGHIKAARRAACAQIYTAGHIHGTTRLEVSAHVHNGTLIFVDLQIKQVQLLDLLSSDYTICLLLSQSVGSVWVYIHVEVSCPSLGVICGSGRG